MGLPDPDKLRTFPDSLTLPSDIPSDEIRLFKLTTAPGVLDYLSIAVLGTSMATAVYGQYFVMPSIYAAAHASANAAVVSINTGFVVASFNTQIGRAA